jgi:hypothetical protein
MNPTDQVRVRITVSVERDFRKARRSYLVERMIGSHNAMEDPEEAMRSEVIRLYRAANNECKGPTA